MDRKAESVALEKKHVHDVYNRIAPHISDTRYKAWPRVKQFLQELEPGSIVADVGCGNGKYLGINNQTFKIGSDCCINLVDISAKRGHEAMVCDNLRLPYRNNCFDAVVSIAVVHHFATVERRIQAIRELARICRPGGLVMIYVWALEQEHRQFDAQDVLVPWHQQLKGSRSRRVKGKQIPKKHNRHSSSSGSDDDDKTEKKLDKGMSLGRTDGRSLKTKLHPAVKAAQNGGIRTRQTKTLQRHTTERDWLREKFPTRRGQLMKEEARILRKSHSCEEGVVLSGKPRAVKTRCHSDSGTRRRLVSRSSSVEEGERGGTLWDGFLQVFPTTFSPTFSGRSEDDITPADANSVFGDDDEDEDLAKNQWCIINRDGTEGTFESKVRGVVGNQVIANRKQRHRHMLNGSGSCDNILANSKTQKNVLKRTPLLLSSQSLDEREFERMHSPIISTKFGAMKKGSTSSSHNSESAINNSNLRGSYPRVSTWGSDTSGFVSSGSVNGESSETSKKLLNWRKQQLKLNLRSDIAKERNFLPLNGVFTRSLELLYKTEVKQPKKPVIGLNFTMAKGETFKPFRSRSHLSQSGSERDHESSFDSVSSSDESLTTYPINPSKKCPADQKRSPELPIRSNSLSMLEKLITKDTKVPDKSHPAVLKPSNRSLSSSEKNSFEDCKGSPLARNKKNDFSLYRRPASNPNFRTTKQETSSTTTASKDNCQQLPQGAEGEKDRSEDSADPSLYLRYYHVFKEGELTDLIEKNIMNLHIVKSYYDHANWCVVAEKVEVWRI